MFDPHFLGNYLLDLWRRAKKISIFSFFTHMHEFDLRCSGRIIGFNLCMIFDFNSLIY